MQSEREYIYYSCSRSAAGRIWDGDAKRYLEQKPMMAELLRRSIGMDVLPAFAPADQAYRLITSGRQVLPNFDSRSRPGNGIPELYKDLVYVADHLDAVWPGDDNTIGAAPGALRVLNQVNYWKLFEIFDRLADSRDSRACRWVYHFKDEDHFLVLPSTARIRAHRDSHLTRDSTSPTGSDVSYSQVDDSSRLESSGSPTSDGPPTDSYRMRFQVLEILHPNKIRISGDQVVKVKPKDLVGRKVGDEAIAYTPSRPKAVIDLTQDGVQVQWQSQLDLDGSGYAGKDLRNGSLP